MEYRIKDNSICTVIGYGSWATALVYSLLKNGKEIWWHISNDEIIDSIRTEGKNARYLYDVELDKSRIHATPDIDEAIRNSEIILIAAPSAYIGSIMGTMTESLEGKFILSATKGIIPEVYSTVTEFFNRNYGLPYRNLGVISGPSHAEEVSRGRLTYLTIACKSEENSRIIGEMFNSESLRIEYSDDIYGIEYAGILKNIYAIAGGFADGLGYGDNFKAVLSSASAAEMSRFIHESYPFKRNTMDAPYLGDLLVTIYSSFSRNRRFGQLIGHGCTIKSALNEMTMIAEGYFASKCIRHINSRYGICMPIADMVYDVLYRNASPRKRMKELAALL